MQQVQDFSQRTTPDDRATEISQNVACCRHGGKLIGAFILPVEAKREGPG